MITIKDSTNIFDSSTQTFESILTGDLKDSKLIFQSDRYNNDVTNENLTNLKFKVELYFDGSLIFDTFTPVLYNSGSYGISNIDLSTPIRDYLITQIGLTTSDDIEDKYDAFRQINNTGEVVIKEISEDLDSYTDIVEPDSISDLLFWMDPSYGISYATEPSISTWTPRVDNYSTGFFDRVIVNSTSGNDILISEYNGKTVVQGYRGNEPTYDRYFHYYPATDQRLADPPDGMTIFTISGGITGETNIISKEYSTGDFSVAGNVSSSLYQMSDGVSSEDVTIEGGTDSFTLQIMSYYPTTKFAAYFNNWDKENSLATYDINDDESEKAYLLKGSVNHGIYAGDIIVYDRRLTDEEINQVQSYLMDKYQIFERTYDTYIYKAVKKDYELIIYNNDVLSTTTDNLLLNRYFNYKYLPYSNVTDLTNNDYYNEVYRSTDLLLNFYDNAISTVIPLMSGSNTEDTFSFEINRTVGSRNVNQICDITSDTFNIHPTTSLEWIVTENTVITSGSNFSTFSDYFADNELDTFQLNDSKHKIYFKYNDECVKYPHQLRWLNTLGGYDTFNFDLIHQEEVQTSDKGYYQNNYSLTDELYSNDFNASYQSYDKKFNKKYVFKTDWLKDDQIYLLEDLFVSPEVYFLNAVYSYGNNAEWLSMKNLTKSKTLYHKDIRGLKKYEITIEESVKKIII